ncbi:hypothetical protein BVRB_8g197420 [Beta vulgaris subsp. vulgaris]|nr:hypothetical protein BVRB_8g197420 [Beta vulgaris subsp. vulgaris]
MTTTLFSYSSTHQAFDLDEALTMPLNISPNQRLAAPDSGPVTRLADLPTVTAGNDVVCSICMEGYFRRSAKRMPCGHVYHTTCIAPWLPISNSCPLCRCHVLSIT